MNNNYVSSAESGAPVSAPAGGRRGSLRKVSAKTVRRVLRSAGVKPKGRVVLGGADDELTAPVAPVTAGRRRRGSRKTRRHKKRGLFGLRR